MLKIACFRNFIPSFFRISEVAIRYQKRILVSHLYSEQISGAFIPGDRLRPRSVSAKCFANTAPCPEYVRLCETFAALSG